MSFPVHSLCFLFSVPDVCIQLFLLPCLVSDAILPSMLVMASTPLVMVLYHMSRERSSTVCHSTMCCQSSAPWTECLLVKTSLPLSPFKCAWVPALFLKDIYLYHLYLSIYTGHNTLDWEPFSSSIFKEAALFSGFPYSWQIRKNFNNPPCCVCNMSLPSSTAQSYVRILLLSSVSSRFCATARWGLCCICLAWAYETLHLKAFFLIKFCKSSATAVLQLFFLLPPPLPV